MVANAKADVFEVLDERLQKAMIRVIGVGGGGCNTVNQMMKAAIPGVEFICVNTDRDHLERSEAGATQVQLGIETTRGLGAGSDPAVGQKAAEEDRHKLKELLAGTDLLFLTAGMGGGTGTGAAPVIASVAKEMGILTVGVVTKPFTHEGPRRLKVAMAGVKALGQHVDSLIIIPNDKLRMILGGSMTLLSGFKAANDVLQNAVQGISDLITRPGMVNVDFADVKTVMANRGMAMMGMGAASGEERAKKAVDSALSSPLLDDIELAGANGILVNITCDETLTLDELELINGRVYEMASEDVDMKCGTSFDSTLNGEIRVTVVATGLRTQQEVQESRQAAQASLIPGIGGIPRVAPTAHTPGSRMQSGLIARTAPVAVRAANESIHVPNLREAQTRVVGLRRASGGGAAMLADYNEELLDVPAFLRAQAD